MANQPTHAIQRFTTLLSHEWAKLDARHRAELDLEDLLDIFWLAHHIQPAPPTPRPAQRPEATVTPQPTPPPGAPHSPQDRDPQVTLSTPPPTAAQTDRKPGLGAGVPLQVPAANALRSQLDLARALRPLMRKLPSPTQVCLDEGATVVQIAEQGVWSPVLVQAPERWFDLAIVVEACPSLKLWEDTIAELQTLVEQLGAFRRIRSWGLKPGQPGTAIQLARHWQPTSTTLPTRSVNTLLDPSGRQMIWLVSDCTSELWDAPGIYAALAKWGKQSPLVIMQLLPERLWARTALGIGQPMRLQAAIPGATQAKLSAGAVPMYPVIEGEEEEAGEGEHSGARSQETESFPPPPALTPDSPSPPPEGLTRPVRSQIILPVISLEPEPVSRWAQVTTGVGVASVAGLQIFLDQLLPPPEGSAAPPDLSPEQRVQQFFATASITAQKLAGLMAAVPVSLPVAHLIQKTLLPQSRQVHLAEVLMGGLLDALPAAPTQPNQPPQPTQYRFPELVREKLIDAVPMSKTTQVLDTVSAYIAERLGLGTKSFAALMVACSQLAPHEQQALQPFAEIGLSTLRRLGGDYRRQADQLAPYLHPAPPRPTWPDFPPLQPHDYQTAIVEVEPLSGFEFETATLARQPQPPRRRKQTQPQANWVISKAPGTGWQRVESLGQGISLELVEIIGGTFWMGSPEAEPEREEDEGPQHEVTIADFFIGKYPITQAQWRAVAALPPIKLALDPDPSDFKGEHCPVESVSWHEAVEFCARLSAQTGREYSLPTEAEWEYACRAGTTTPFHFGEMINPDLANYDGDSAYHEGPTGFNRQTTTPVGSFPANGWGVFDLHGNVWEWCADHWHENYADKPEALKAAGNTPWLSNDEAAARSLRGGSWFNVPWYCRSAIRGYPAPDGRLHYCGFRVVCRAAKTLT